MTAGRAPLMPPGTDPDGVTPPAAAPPSADPVTVEQDLPAAVTAVLAEFLAPKREACAAISPAFGEAADDLARFVLDGGKRLRPVFAWWGWRGAGGAGHDDAGAVLRAVGALELIQAGALVHDDLIDDSDTRRGSPTVHARWATRHQDASWVGDPARFGSSVAVLLGDVALAWADDMLRAAGLDPVARTRLTPVWEAMRTEVLGGQFLDLHGHAAGGSSPETALRISRYKTAAYTVERPLHLGAALAGADDAAIRAYRRYGTDVGTAFQLRDDVLGVFGDPEVTGKPAGDDLREGKLTLLVALARAHPDRATAAAVERAVGDPGLGDDGVRRARAALVELGVVDEVEARIASLTDSGLAALDDVDLTVPARDKLAGLAVAAGRRAH